MQQTQAKINKLLFSGFFWKDIKHNSSFASVFVFGILFFSFLIFTPLAHASTTNGTISSTYKYAWSNVGGYINFAPNTSTVSVTDSALSGHVWSKNTGWINLSPSTGGVTNNGNGVLGGFAWDSLEGWVSFSGVTIDSSGRFHGKAVGTNETISFDCTHCDVRTDWRPASTRTKTAVNYGFVPTAFSTPNPLPYKNTSTVKTKQTTVSIATSTQHLLPSITLSSHSSHNTNAPVQEKRTVTKHSTIIAHVTPSIENKNITVPVVTPIVTVPATNTPLISKTNTITTTSSSSLRTATYVGGGALILIIIFFAVHFFI